jgi:transcriptional regulator with XRE-family HTH domain
LLRYYVITNKITCQAIIIAIHEINVAFKVIYDIIINVIFLGGIKMELNQNIKTRRLAVKMTQEELANKIGTTKQTINKYETAIITNIPLDKIELIAKTLGCTPAYLMGWEEKEKPANKDELQNKIDDLFINLSAEKQQEALNYLRFLKGQSNNS